MREFIIKIAITAGTVIVLALSALGVKSCVDSRAVAQKEAKHQKAQSDIRAMITLCDFNKIDDKEQESINACGDDVIAAKGAIQNIISDRVVYWTNRLTQEDERAEKLINIKKNSNYWSEDNERQYKEVGGKVVKDIETAQRQVKYWTGLRKQLNETNADGKVVSAV